MLYGIDETYENRTYKDGGRDYGNMKVPMEVDIFDAL